MKKQRLKKLVKDFKKEENLNIFTRRTFEDFTIKHEGELDFACEEVEKPFDRYTIAKLSGNVLTADKKFNKFVSLIFSWEAIPDNLEEFEDEEEFTSFLWDLYKQAQNIRKGNFNFD